MGNSWMLLWRFDVEPLNRPTASFIGFSRLEHAQVAHEHTQYPTFHIGSAGASFVDAINIMLTCYKC